MEQNGRHEEPLKRLFLYRCAMWYSVCGKKAEAGIPGFRRVADWLKFTKTGPAPLFRAKWANSGAMGPPRSTCCTDLWKPFRCKCMLESFPTMPTTSNNPQAINGWVRRLQAAYGSVCLAEIGNDRSLGPTPGRCGRRPKTSPPTVRRGIAGVSAGSWVHLAGSKSRGQPSTGQLRRGQKTLAWNGPLPGPTPHADLARANPSGH